MKFTIEIPDDQFAEVLAAIPARRGWTATIDVRDPDTGEVSQVVNPISAEDVLLTATLKFWEDEATAQRQAGIAPATPAKFDAVKA